MPTYPYRDILDISVASISLKNIPFQIASLIETGSKKSIFYINAHCLNLASKDTVYKEILQKASIVYSGGLGPVLASKILGESLIERTPTPDFILNFLSIAQRKNWSIYLLGTNEKSLEKLVNRLHHLFPNLQIVGYHHGFFERSDEQKIAEEINRKKPTIVFAGMGSPKQEKWIKDNFDRIDARAFWAVGALFDVLSGELPRAPFFMQKIGLEWFFRMLQEPNRLWKRYTIGNLLFVCLVFKDFYNKRFSQLLLLNTQSNP